MSLNRREIIGYLPAAFGGTLVMRDLNGTDISGYQPENPNLNGDAFSIVKASEGVGYQNDRWAAQVDACRAAGAMVGHYHFANGNNTAAAEADYFWNTVKGKWQSGEPCALDIEGNWFTASVSGKDPVGWALAFAQEFYAQSGLKVLVYIDWQHEKSASYNWQSLVDYNCGLWGAAYNSTGYGDPSPWPFVVIWQNADTNTSGGDSDVLYGDASTFKAYGTPATSGDDMGTLDAITPAAMDNLAKMVHDQVQLVLNEKGIPGVINDHTDAAVKGVGLNITDAQAATLADKVCADLEAKLPPAVLAAVKAQWQK